MNDNEYNRLVWARTGYYTLSCHQRTQLKDIVILPTHILQIEVGECAMGPPETGGHNVMQGDPSFKGQGGSQALTSWALTRANFKFHCQPFHNTI